jgi:hypothetical protein
MTKEKTLQRLAGRIMQVYEESNLALVEVGRLLNEARAQMGSNNEFGKWCRDTLASDIARSQAQRWRMMVVAKWVDANEVDFATICRMGWSGLVEAASRLQSDDIDPSEAQAATDALIARVREGKPTSAEVVQTINAAAPKFSAQKKKKKFEALTMGAPVTTTTTAKTPVTAGKVLDQLPERVVFPSTYLDSDGKAVLVVPDGWNQEVIKVWVGNTAMNRPADCSGSWLSIDHKNGNQTVIISQALRDAIIEEHMNQKRADEQHRRDVRSGRIKTFTVTP